MLTLEKSAMEMSNMLTIKKSTMETPEPCVKFVQT